MSWIKQQVEAMIAWVEGVLVAMLLGLALWLGDDDELGEEE